LGSYDPLPNSHGEKLVALNLDRIRHWIGCGAHLSKPMEKLLGNSSLVLTHLRDQPQDDENEESFRFLQAAQDWSGS
jgi:ribosomal protein S16